MTSIWIVRSGYDYEFESEFFGENRIFLPLPQIQDIDLTEIETYGDIRDNIEYVLGNGEEVKARELSDIAANFCLGMQKGDLILLPLRGGEFVAIGQIISPYGYDSANPLPFRHLREVQWITKNSSSHTFYKEIKHCVEQYQLNSRISDPIIEKEVYSEIGKVLRADRVEPAIEVQPPASFDVKLEARLDENQSVEPSEGGPSHQDGSFLSNKVTLSHADPAYDSKSDHRLVDQFYPLGDSSISLKALLIVEHLVETLGLIGLLENILKVQGFRIINEPSIVRNSSTLIAAKGELGLGGSRILLHVTQPGKLLGDLELTACKNLIETQYADRFVFAIWEDEIQDNELRELTHQGWIIWNRIQILIYLLESYDRFDDAFRARFGLKKVWTTNR